MKNFLLFCGSLVLSCALGAQAEFPERAVTLVVPTAQGEVAHTVARLIAGKLTEHWGRAVFADAKPGNDGAEGVLEAADAKPDGHVLLVGTVGTHVLRPAMDRSLPYDAQKAFAPVSLLIETPLVVVVAASTKAQSPRDLAALAKPKAPPLKAVAAGTGTPAHVAALLFESISKIPLTHAASKDGALALKALADGGPAVAFVPLPEALESIKSGRVRALAVTSAQRSPALPRLQTVAESGFAGYELTAWAGVFAPAGTPAATLDKIARDAGRAVNSSDARHALEQRGVLVVGSNPAQFRARIQRDRERTTRLLKEKGIAG
jgi:tripartite-type tricarboxylate transporter receptor subunit TctC